MLVQLELWLFLKECLFRFAESVPHSCRFADTCVMQARTPRSHYDEWLGFPV